MNADQIAQFAIILEGKRVEIIKREQQTLDQNMVIDAANLPDEMDLASSEDTQSLTFQLGERELLLLVAIDNALERIRERRFGECEECGENISIKRLEIRPESALCVRCQELEERKEQNSA